MLFLALKAALSGIIIVAVAEIAKRNAALGALVVSLPLISILAILWLWRETHEPERIAAHAEATFWYVLPTLPMFLVLPMLLRHGVGFWAAMALSCLMTVMLYLLAAWTAGRFGVNL
jgi:hypothetical protein